MNINLLLLNFVLEICAYQTNTLDALEAAIANAVAEVSKRKSAQDQAINGDREENVTLRRRTGLAFNPVNIHAMFSYRRETHTAVEEIGKAGDIVVTATEIYASRTGMIPDAFAFTRQLKRVCPVRQATCDPSNPYRIVDGSCNNIAFPLWGAAITNQPRFLPPDYGDKFNLGSIPRTKSVTGLPLPSPRVISNAVHQGGFSEPRSRIFNVAFTHFGQFVDHDVIATPILDEGNPISCCSEGRPVKRPECFPFPTPPGDFRSTCMSFVRSAFGVEPGCPPCARNQINQVSSFVDLSVTYGNTMEGQNALRERGTGRLIEGPGRILPDASTDMECVMSDTCFLSGDNRNSEVPMLNVIHTIFHRDHNNIVEGLRMVNPKWNSERLFQTAKKILTGIYQHIVYTEFLPIVLGQEGMDMFGLQSVPVGHSHQYNPTVHPATRNAFGAAAFRFGHTLIGSFVGANNPYLRLKAFDKLENHFFSTNVTRNQVLFGTDGIGRWMSVQPMSKADRILTPTVRDRLFQTMPGNGFDLSALNMQRGRDHGIPSYNHWRKFCGLHPALHFGTGPLGLCNHDPFTAAALRSVYRHPDDIDLFAGALSEQLAPGALVGPTFRCIIGLQFRMYKVGDRFFYENNFFPTGFTPAQLKEIKSQTMSSLYCRAISISSMPENAFASGISGSPRIPCNFFRKLNMLPWKEY